MQRARVSAEYRASYDVLFDGVIARASLRGHFHDGSGEAFPKVGDYVVVSPAAPGQVVIESIEPRQNVIARLSPKDGDVQVLVANVDYLFIVMGLDGDFNIARLERYLALAEQSSVVPVVILNKMDRTNELQKQIEAVQGVVKGVPVFAISAKTGEGVEALQAYLKEGMTVVLFGSSGAGKSTLTNFLLADAVQPTNTLRERDDRGRHTTTHRQLFVLPSGGHLIDTPGMRELALLDTARAANDAFTDIAALAGTCRFTNCDHEKSAGCALLAALANGTLEQKRYARFMKLSRGEERLRRIRN